MPTLQSLFSLHTAKSVGLNDHNPGAVAFITNGLRHNGVVGFVQPHSKDKVFDFVAIVVSTFCEATVQVPPFIARGNGGSGLIVLQPKSQLSVAQLQNIAAQINTSLRWRFSWYRQATVDRIKNLSIPSVEPVKPDLTLSKVLPLGKVDSDISTEGVITEPFRLDELYDLRAGDFHSIGDLQIGHIPLISCGDLDNGITAFVEVPETMTYQDKLTIAFNGDTLTAKYHPYRFAAKDDVAVCFPRVPMSKPVEMYIQLILRSERWRYSYYRKCYLEKLQRFTIHLPVSESGEIAEHFILQIISNHPYWQFIQSQFQQYGV